MAEMISVFKSPEGEAKNLAAYECVLSHWPVAYEELDLPTQFGTTHIIVSGPLSGKPVILLHGQDSCAISWIYNVAELSRTFRIYALDTIGDIGKSKPTHQPNSREDYAKWMLEVFEQLKIEKADLIGLSYGGFLAMNFALAFPGRVNRIVLLSPGIPNFGPPTLQWANYGMPMMLFPSRFTIKRFISGISMKGYSQEDPVHVQMIMGIINMRKVSFMRPVFTEEEFKRIDMPILLMIGDHEIMYEPQKALDSAARLIPGLQAKLIPNANHMLNRDQAEMINALTLQFLKED
jgi:pimeloyl-ACP methyl ester carboxylesterase